MTPDSFRQRAAECRENARAARDPENRARWMEMAEFWLLLADEQDLGAHRWHGLGAPHWAALEGALQRTDERRRGPQAGADPDVPAEERATRAARQDRSGRQRA